MTSFLLQDFSFSSMLFGSLQTSYGGCINPPVRSIQENVSTAPFNERNVPIKNNFMSLACEILSKTAIINLLAMDVLYYNLYL